MPLARRRSVLPVLLLAALLPGCAHRAAPPQPAPPPAAAPPDRRLELAAIVALLDQGQPAGASPRIDALLARDPADADARVLRDSIDRDPVALLGSRSYAYTVRPGETMLGLSERLLGNRLKSYQLARYNGIAVPASLAAGTVLRIPGVAPQPEPRPPARPRAPARARPDAAPHGDPDAARRARSAGLAALVRGRTDLAVAALRRAAALAPADPLIQRDLARAERIVATGRPAR